MYSPLLLARETTYTELTSNESTKPGGVSLQENRGSCQGLIAQNGRRFPAVPPTVASGKVELERVIVMTDTPQPSSVDPPSNPWTWPVDPHELLHPTVLYFEQECLVVNKPAGLLTQSPPGIPSVEAQARRFFINTATHRAADPIEQRLIHGPAEFDYVGIPHRLDRATSGALLLGQSKPVTRKLAAQFEKRTIKKIYWALLEGLPPEPAGTWTDWMRKLPEQALSEVTESTDPAAQSAELDFQVLAQDAGVSLVEILLKTGRTHQIRLQASSRGWPIIGDAEYGSRMGFGEAFDDHRRRAIALHARTIDFWHPKLHRPVVVHAPVSETWHQFAAENATKLRPLLDTKMV